MWWVGREDGRSGLAKKSKTLGLTLEPKISWRLCFFLFHYGLGVPSAGNE